MPYQSSPADVIGERALYPAEVVTSENATLTGPQKIFLICALGRATIRPFTPYEWSGYMGAMGKAHMIEFLPEDLSMLAVILGFGHWRRHHAEPGKSLPLAEVTTVILDEGGITFNAMDHRAYAAQIVVSLGVELWDGNFPPADEA